jgi:uncharacterized protein YcnI
MRTLDVIMIRSLLIGALAIAIATPAAAHVTLENQEAKVGASYKAVFRVPHGCDGTATTAIRVKIPEGVIGVKSAHVGDPRGGRELAYRQCPTAGARKLGCASRNPDQRF